MIEIDTTVASMFAFAVMQSISTLVMKTDSERVSRAVTGVHAKLSDQCFTPMTLDTSCGKLMDLEANMPYPQGCKD
jgi:hypothetical protein